MYIIRIQKIEVEEKGGERWVDIYEQHQENLDIQAVIAVVNQLEKSK